MSLAEFNQSPDSPQAVEADVLRGAVETYCVEFEQRADVLLVRLERTR